MSDMNFDKLEREATEGYLDREDTLALIAAARELAELKGALEMLERNSGRVRDFWLPENLLKAARELGWTGKAK